MSPSPRLHHEPHWSSRYLPPPRPPRPPSRRWAAVRLLLYAAAVLGTYCWVRSFDPRPWAAVLIAAGPAVLLSPVVLLSVPPLLRGTRRD